MLVRTTELQEQWGVKELREESGVEKSCNRSYLQQLALCPAASRVLHTCGCEVNYFQRLRRSPAVSNTNIAQIAYRAEISGQLTGFTPFDDANAKHESQGKTCGQQAIGALASELRPQ